MEGAVMTADTTTAIPVAVSDSSPALDHAAIAAEETDDDDIGYGWAMFTAFTGAVLGITFVVCVLALVGSWWMLGVAVLVHVVVTATMIRLVYGAFGAEVDAYPDMHRAEAVSRAAIAAAVAR